MHKTNFKDLPLGGELRQERKSAFHCILPVPFKFQTTWIFYIFLILHYDIKKKPKNPLVEALLYVGGLLSSVSAFKGAPDFSSVGRKGAQVLLFSWGRAENTRYCFRQHFSLFINAREKGVRYSKKKDVSYLKITSLCLPLLPTQTKHHCI